MSSDTLGTLLRIRRTGLQEAQRALAGALAQRQQAQSRRETEEQHYAEEAIAALDLNAGDEVVDTFSRWLPIGRRTVEQALEEEQVAAGEVERARAFLGLARAACRSVELLVEKRAEESRHAARRLEQRTADDLVRRASAR